MEKSQRIKGVRGVGTQVWIDTKTPNDAFTLQAHLKKQGVLVQLNAMHGVVAKPALILESNDAQALSRALAKF